MNRQEIYRELTGIQKNLKKIDTHEHISSERDTRNSKADILDILLIPYNCDSLLSAGLSREDWARVTDHSIPLKERYRLIEPYLPLIRHTAFFRATEKTLKKEFGEDSFSLESLERADRLLKQKIASFCLKSHLERDGFEKVISFAGYDALSAYMDGPVRYVPTVSEILPRSEADIQKLERISGECISDLDSLKAAIEALFTAYSKGGVTAVKFGSGYRRVLDFSVPDREKAEKELMSVLSLRTMGDTRSNGSRLPAKCYDELLKLDDYLTDFMLRLSRKHGFAVVFHTAMHAWNENDPARAHAHYLTGLIERYPDVPIVLLHAGAPFFEEAILLSRYFKNVYLDLTWLHVISPVLAKEAIIRIMELVPINKVFAYGGDYCNLFSASGSLDTAIGNFACAFTAMIEEGGMTLEDAESILSMWYYENPKKVFKI